MHNQSDPGVIHLSGVTLCYRDPFDLKCNFPTCTVTEKLLRCSGCKAIYYCSVSHQKLDWSSHKPTCKFTSSQKLSELCRMSDETIIPQLNSLSVFKSNEERIDITITIVSKLVQSFEFDMYPGEDIEKIFGIKMNSDNDDDRNVLKKYPIGNLLFTVWQLLWKCYIEFESGSKGVNLFKITIKKALLAGELPSWFRQNVEKYGELWNKKHGVNAYLKELQRREYQGINWDDEIHKLLKLES